VKISNILDKIDEHQLFVPAFQREYVWKRPDAKQLIDSLIKEYPTGTMLTWETSNPPLLKGGHIYTETQGAVKLLLDGQQRITTLYMLIRGEIPPYYTPPEIIDDTRGLYVNLSSLELLYHQKTRMENDPYWQDITDIFKGKIDPFDLRADFEERGIELSMESMKTINSNINAIVRILDREFPEQIIPPKANIKEAIDIFYKVNASGVALTEAELALAQISGYWPEARDLIKTKLSALAEEGYVFKLDFVVYALLGCMYHLGSDMGRLHAEENLDSQLDDGQVIRLGIKEVWDILDKYVLDYVVNLLRSRAFVDHTDEVNSVYAIIPIIVFFYKTHGEVIPDQQLWRIVKWFYYSQLRRRYVSQLPQKLDFDLRIIRDSERPFEELLGVISDESRLEITPDEFVGRSVSHPLFGLMKWYLKSRGAKCFTTGLGLHKNMGRKYQLEKDHIFPSAVLKKNGYGRENRSKYALAQELTNRALLTQVANRRKSDMGASEYLSGIKEKSPKLLDGQLIPENEALWSVDQYESFLSARRRLLSEHLNTYLNGLATEVEADYGSVSIEELISEGESGNLEFKSSLRWDYRQGCVNKKLESVIVKTVAAFANSEGGALLIGVDDDGNILGLDNDCASLKGGDIDYFEIHVRNLLNQGMGTAFVASSVKFVFPTIGDKEVCQIDVGSSADPIMLAVNDGGKNVQKFYVRSGNTSQELSMTEFNSYQKGRFGQ
jgi:hypothetical protein